MQLDYRKTRSGLYILKKEDFDDIACLRGVYCLEQGIILIEDDITRAVAKETLQEGRSCEAVALEMGVTRRMIEYRKKNAEQKIADFAQKYGLVSRDV